MSEINLESVYVSNSGEIKAYGEPKGIVQEFADLPTTGISVNDVYSVLSEDGSYYVYNGSSWEKCGGVGHIKGESGDYLTKDDIVNNAETDDPTKVASAAALKSVNDSLNNIDNWILLATNTSTTKVTVNISTDRNYKKICLGIEVNGALKNTVIVSLDVLLNDIPAKKISCEYSTSAGNIYGADFILTSETQGELKLQATTSTVRTAYLWGC